MKHNTFDLEGDLAENWEISADGKSFTFKLRQGVMFHGDFGELTSEDVVFSLDRVRDPKMASPHRAALASIDKVEAVDRYSVRLILRRPDPALVYQLADPRPGSIVSKKAVQEMGAQKFAQNPIGSGPYMLKDWVPNDKVVLEGNSRYFRGQPNIKRVVTRLMGDFDSALLAFRAGEVDLIPQMDPTESVVRQVQSIPNAKIAAVDRLGILWLEFDLSHPILKDLRVRQAIAHAIDRNIIANYVYAGMGQVNWSFVHPQAFGYSDDVLKYPYDPEKSRRLLAEAGYANGITIPYQSTNLWILKGPALALQDQLSKVGIQLNITFTEAATFQSNVWTGRVPMFAWARPTPPDPGSLFRLKLHSASIGTPDRPGQNASKYKAIDNLIEGSESEINTDRRKHVYAQIQKKISEDLPLIPIGVVRYGAIVRSDLKGIPERDAIPDFEFFQMRYN